MTLAIALLLLTGYQSGLQIKVVEGEDAVNIIQQKTAVAPVVEVRDRNNQPVAGAVVTFAIRNGSATFNGARTLTVTTNAAGRAAAAGLTPTGSGALQISASASFQGQTAAVTITQTNVMTAAQATQAASGGAGGAATAGAAASGAGGGFPAATVGIIGGAAAGGLVVVRNVLSGAGDEETDDGGAGAPSAPSQTTYTGSFQITSVFTATSTRNGAVEGMCTLPLVHRGTITIRVDNSTGVGDFRAEWTNTAGGSSSGAFECLVPAPSDGVSGTLTGSRTSPQFRASNTYSSQIDPGRIEGTRTASFDGTVSGDTINGTWSIALETTLVAPVQPGVGGRSGFSGSTQVTLRRQ